MKINKTLNYLSDMRMSKNKNTKQFEILCEIKRLRN